jgi:hypothetical protein
LQQQSTSYMQPQNHHSKRQREPYMLRNSKKCDMDGFLR